MSANVKLEPNLQDADAFYERLLEAHEGLTTEQSFELNARLVMLLANQIGDAAVLEACVGLARSSGRYGDAPGTRR